MKRGQATLLIILGLIVVVLLMGAYYLFYQVEPITEVTQTIVETEQQEEILLELENCIELIVVDSLIHIGENGGLYDEINFLVNEGINNVPDENTLNEEFLEFFETYVPYCLYYVDYQDYEIESGEVESDVTLTDNSVKLEITYPLQLTGENSFSIAEPFYYEYDIPLKTYLDVANEIIDEYLVNNRMCISCISTIGTENDLNINMLFEEEGQLIIIEDENVDFSEGVYYFAFMV